MDIGGLERRGSQKGLRLIGGKGRRGEEGRVGLNVASSGKGRQWKT